jgi:hypothetical protein
MTSGLTRTRSASLRAHHLTRSSHCVRLDWSVRQARRSRCWRLPLARPPAYRRLAHRHSPR